MESNFILEIIKKFVAMLTSIFEVLGLDTSRIPSFDFEEDTEAAE